MSKSIFISYVYEDKKWLDQLKEWSSKKLLGENIQITFERGDYRQRGDTAVKEEIISMIQGATEVIFLIGQNSHNHSWVDYEAECAIAKNKKIILIRIPDTNGRKPKSLLSYIETPFDVNKIKTLLI